MNAQIRSRGGLQSVAQRSRTVCARCSGHGRTRGRGSSIGGDLLRLCAALLGGAGGGQVGALVPGDADWGGGARFDAAESRLLQRSLLGPADGRPAGRAAREWGCRADARGGIRSGSRSEGAAGAEEGGCGGGVAVALVSGGVEAGGMLQRACQRLGGSRRHAGGALAGRTGLPAGGGGKRADGSGPCLHQQRRPRARPVQGNGGGGIAGSPRVLTVLIRLLLLAELELRAVDVGLREHALANQGSRGGSKREPEGGRGLGEALRVRRAGGVQRTRSQGSLLGSEGGHCCVELVRHPTVQYGGHLHGLSECNASLRVACGSALGKVQAWRDVPEGRKRMQWVVDGARVLRTGNHAGKATTR